MMRKLYDFFLNVSHWLFNHLFLKIFILMLALALMFCILDFDSLKSVLTYPEEDYQALRAEANRIVSERNFESEYMDRFESERKENNTISLRIVLNKNLASVIIYFNNYGAVDEEIKINEEFTSNSYFITMVCLLIMVLFLISFVLYLCCGVFSINLAAIFSFFMVRALKKDKINN